MAARGKVQHSPTFPTVTTTADLPNAAGSPTQSPYLEVGDMAYVTGLTRWHSCKNPSLGAAEWRPVTAVVGQLVYEESDLPAPVAGVITLSGGTVYNLMQPVTLTAGNRIEMPANTSLVGVVPNVTQLLGDVNGPLVTLIAPTASGTSWISGVRLENTNTGASACALRTNTAAGVCTVNACVLTCPNGAAKLDAAGYIKFLSSTCIASLAGKDTVTLGQVGGFAAEYSDFRCSGAASRLVAILAGAVVPTFTLVRCSLTFDAVTQVGVYLDGTASITRAVTERLVRVGAAGTVNSGWDQGSFGWRALSVDTLPDSAAVGGSYVNTAPFTVTFPGGAGTWVKLAPAAGTPWLLESDSERFSLVSTSDGQIKYTGQSPLRFLIVANVTLSKTGTTVASRLGVFVNNALHSGTAIQSDVTTRATSRGVAPAIVTLVTNDVVDLRVMNIDNADSFDVAGGALSALAGNIS